MKMKEALMMQGARTIMDNCVSLRAGENILIITDMVQENIAKVLAAAAVERGAEVVMSVMKPRKKSQRSRITESSSHLKLALFPELIVSDLGFLTSLNFT